MAVRSLSIGKMACLRSIACGVHCERGCYVSLSVTEVMEVIDGYSARDLEVLQVYIQKIRDEWAKGKRGKRVHGLNWSQEARRVLLLGLQVRP